jgi:hypothetical protein
MSESRDYPVKGGNDHNKYISDTHYVANLAFAIG